MSGVNLLRRSALSRAVFGVALMAGSALVSMPFAAPAMAKDKAAAPAAAKTDYSKPFMAAAAPIEKTLGTTAKDPKVNDLTNQIKAATDPAQQATLRQQQDAALGGLNAQVDAAVAAATTPDDKFAAGNFTLNLGILMADQAAQLKGLKMMADSGRVAPDKAGTLYFNVGALEYNAKDFASARQHLAQAEQAGYADPDLGKMIADSYFRENNPTEGFRALQAAVDRKTAAGQPVPSSYFLSGVAWADKVKDINAIAHWGSKYVLAENTPKAWSDVLTTMVIDGKFQKPEMLDLYRLMVRTNAMTEVASYYEYIDDADPRQLPAEVARAIRAGIAAGVLKADEQQVKEALAMANSRITADKASLPGLAASARTAANGIPALATADAFLAHGDLPNAIDLYKVALAKGGIDKDRANTRLGIALADSGDLAGARAAFGLVGGVRAPLATMWLAYLTQKGG